MKRYCLICDEKVDVKKVREGYGCVKCGAYHQIKVIGKRQNAEIFVYMYRKK